MKQILRIMKWILIIGSIILGLYVGVYVMLFGGIAQIVNSLSPLNGVGVATGILKIIFCEMSSLIPTAGYCIAIYLQDKFE